MALTKPNQSILDITEGMKLGAVLTIASGAVTLTENAHAIDTEASAASDDLTRINHGPVSDGALVMVYAANGDRTVVLKHAADNILLANGSDYALDDAHKSILLRRDGENFRDIVMPTPAGGHVLIEKKTASSSASLDFVTGITAEFDEYILTGFLQPETDDVQLGLAFSTDGGTTFATGYHSFGRYGTQGGLEYVENGSAGNEIFIGDDTALAKVGNQLSDGIWFSLKIVNASNPELTKIVRGECTYVSADGGLITGSLGGLYNSGSATNGFRIAFLSGNIASGDVRLIGTKF